MTDNVVTRMFTWWNRAYASDGFTAEGFGDFFTNDAPFVVDGNLRATGPAEIAAHFRRIRQTTTQVELMLPVLATLSDSEIAFVRYGATFENEEGRGSESCMALATLRNDRIASFEVMGRLD